MVLSKSISQAAVAGVGAGGGGALEGTWWGAWRVGGSGGVCSLGPGILF